MTFTIKGSHIVALAITIAIGVYMYYGQIEIGGQSNASTQAPAIAEREEVESSDLFRVSYVEIKPETRINTIRMRGRTQADEVIPVKGQTSGILRERLVDRGDHVNEGQLVCVIERGAREADLASSQAALARAQIEFDSNEKLNKKGFTTDTRMQELTATLNAAKAQLKRAELELSYTEIRANASGVVQDPIAAVGDMLPIGGTCVTLVDRDPMFFVGQLSESDIGAVRTGMKAKVDLVTGVSTSGEITYIAPSADPQTRTFRVEIKLEDTGGTVRDGLTASTFIATAETTAYRISPSWLTLADDGRVGVKVIDENDVVSFQEVTIVSQGKQGFWIENIKQGSRVITLGQEYVVDGEKVEPVLQQAINQEVTQ